MPTFYCTKSSLFSQSCLVLIKLLNLDIEIEEQELGQDDINPIMKVPVFIDEELVLTEPRAIMVYLAETSDLYSSDRKKRATINQRLFYDSAVVFPSLMKLIRPMVLEKKKEVQTKHKDAFLAVFRVLEGLLVHTEFFANNEISLADVAIFPSILTATQLGLNLSQFPSLNGWCERIKIAVDSTEVTACAENVANLMKTVF